MKSYREFFEELKNLTQEESLDKKYKEKLKNIVFKYIKSYCNCNEKYVYKYVSNKDNYDIENLKSGQLFFIRSDNFNNPKDYLVNFDENKILLELKNEVFSVFSYCIKMANLRAKGEGIEYFKGKIITEETIFEDLKKFLKDETLPEKYRDMIENFLLKRKKSLDDLKKDLQTNTYITCFSEGSNEENMWINYANNFEGFCLKYSLEELSTFNDFDRFNEMESIIEFFSKVLYEERKPDISNKLKWKKYRNNENLNILLRYIGIYSKEKMGSNGENWEIEKEWRWAISIIEGKNIKKYKGIRAIEDKGILKKVPLPKAIFIGRNMKKEQIEKIKKYCEENNIILENK